MKKALTVAAVLVWLFVIYCFSAQTAEDSSLTSQGIVNFILKLLNIDNVYRISYIIRKLAHFTLYFILAMLVIRLARQNNYMTAILVVAVYAATDELHQLLSDGRSGEILDVLIDTSGGFLAIVWDYITKKLKLTKI